jgi:short-subunit dehydrogenase
MPDQGSSFALVTGASSGIGFELARCFAQDGYPLIIAARHEEGLNRAAEALRMEGAPRVESVPVDLSKPDGPPKLFQAVHKLGLDLEFLVNNAGVGVFGDFARDTDLHDELSMIQLNLVSVVHLTKLFVRPMVERGSGKILITSSVTSEAMSPNLTVYSATKAFGHTFAEALGSELKDTGVTVTALLPDATETAFFKRAGAADTAIGQSKKADPAEIAAAGYQAMMDGANHVVAPTQSKLTAALARVLPDRFVADKAKAQ